MRHLFLAVVHLVAALERQYTIQQTTQWRHGRCAWTKTAKDDDGVDDGVDDDVDVDVDDVHDDQEGEEGGEGEGHAKRKI